MDNNYKVLPYIRILQTRSIEEDTFPSEQEVVSYLKLLKCFKQLKSIVCDGITDPTLEDRFWKCYLIMAERRFLIFLNVAKKFIDFNGEEAFERVMKEMLPPIDVIMVWTSLLLSGNVLREQTTRNNVKAFLDCEFPLVLISEQISNSTFIYNPADHLWHKFVGFIAALSPSPDHLEYSSYADFDPINTTLDMYCPCCQESLTTIPVTSFVQQDFSFQLPQNCSCGFDSCFSFDEMRKRSFWQSVMHLYCSREQEVLEENKLRLLGQYFQVLKEKPFVVYVQEQRGKISTKSYTYLNSFLDSSVTQLSIWGNQISVNANLQSEIKAQEEFLDSVERLNFIMSFYLEDIIEHAAERYKKFWKLAKETKYPVVPTLDIDLIWQTHQLVSTKYRAFAEKFGDVVLTYSNKRNHSSIPQRSQITDLRYKEMFNEDLSMCFCPYCLFRRSRTKSLFSNRSKNGVTSSPPVPLNATTCQNKGRPFESSTSILPAIDENGETPMSVFNSACSSVSGSLWTSGSPSSP